LSDAARDNRHGAGPASAFFRENEPRLLASAAIGPTLDLACGRGRHTLAAAALGLSVVAIDHNPAFLAALADIQPRALKGGTGQIETLCADLQSPPLPPLEPGSFGAVLVFRYLHRPILPWIETLIAPGGFVLYETFTEDQRKLGWGPKREAHLLRSGELPSLFPGLVLEVYEEGPSNDDRAACTARLLARRPLGA